MQRSCGVLHVSSCYLTETTVQLFGCQQTCRASNQCISQQKDHNPLNLKVKISTDVVTHVADQGVNVWLSMLARRPSRADKLDDFCCTYSGSDQLPLTYTLMAPVRLVPSPYHSV